MATVTPEYVPREEDREFFQRELEEFVPDRVFDAHTHLWHPDHNVFADRLPSLVDYETYVRLMEDIYPNRVAKGLFLPTFRDPKFIGAANQWTGEQTAKDPSCRGHFFVTPEDDPEWVRQEVKRLKLHGLKCYHTLARHVNPTWEAEIPDYLPESIISVANQESWTDFAETLAARGFFVITFDFRGHGISPGDRDLGIADGDLASAVRFMRTTVGRKHLFLVGASMGGTASLKVASREDVLGVVSLSAPDSIRGLNALSEVSRVQAPKLFIAAEEDSQATRSAQRLFESASEPKELRLFPASGQGTDMLKGEDGQSVRELIIRFLEQHR